MTRLGEAGSARSILGAGPSPGQVAVVDIGSNSIRLVVFDGRGRALWPLYNEKVLCGLGKGLAASGRLNPEGVELARQNLVRFTRLAAAMGVDRIDLLATAAVREAADGPDFVAEIERLCGHPVRVLDGPEEARLAALGVRAGVPDADGVMGDLGGGSLELVELTDAGDGRSSTLPLGPFRLMETGGGSRGAMRDAIDRALEDAGWAAKAWSGSKPRRFYPVGGAWRNLARIHIEQSGYPLHVIHGYTMKGGEVEDLSQLIGRQSLRSLGRMRGVTRRRLETLPAAALVLARVVAALRYKEVVFSAYGLREGHVFSLLPDAEKTEDPLLAAAAEIAAREARFDDLGAALVDWTAPLFPGESPAERRLRTAACRLSDIAWREHPDYRAPQALSRILYFPFSGVSHADRVYMAYSAFVRYGGALKASAVKPYLHLLDDEQVQSARVLGLAQRLAYRVSGATRAVLARCELSYDGTTLRLRLPDDGSAPGGEAVERRFQALAETLGAKKAVMEG